MATRTYKKPSPEQERKRNVFKEMAALLDDQLKKGEHKERLEKATKEVVGLDRYSPLNQLLILTQFPDATEVAGYVEWQKRGRQVRKKEPGIAIRAPHTSSNEEGAKIGFHRTYVWDISQVDPIENKEED
jgi:hypothetical protein